MRITNQDWAYQTDKLRHLSFKAQERITNTRGKNEKDSFRLYADFCKLYNIKQSDYTSLKRYMKDGMIAYEYNGELYTDESAVDDAIYQCEDTYNDEIPQEAMASIWYNDVELVVI